MLILAIATILILAAYRITMLIIEDEILDTPRNAVFRKIKTGGYLYILLTCYRCLGFWVSVFVVGLYWLFPQVTPWILAPFALSALIVFIDKKVS